jgi:hypothetical protein
MMNPAEDIFEPPVRAEGDNTGGQAYWGFVYGYIAASIKAAERQLNS